MKKINSVVLEQGKPLFGKFYEQIKVTNDGKFWLFSDRIRNQIFVFRNDGSFYSVLGERGRGPEGILQIVGFDVNEKNEAFIFDASQKLLKVFSLNDSLLYSTEFFKDVEFSPTAFGLRWYKNDIVSTVIERKYLQEPQKSRLVSIMKPNGVPDTLFGIHDPFTKEDNKHTVFNEVAIDNEKGLLYTNLQSSPYYQIFDLEEKEQVAYVGQPGKRFKIPAQEIDINLPVSEKKKRAINTTVNRRIYLTNKFVIQHRQILTEQWFELGEVSAKENYLVVYDKATNEFIEEVKVDKVPIGVHNNQLYMVEDLDPDNYTIGIYELVEEKSSIKEN